MADFSFNQQLALTLIDKALVGGVLTIAVYGLNKLLESFKSERAGWLETVRNQLTKHDETERTIRQAVADLVKKIAAGSHIICWLCWYAKNAPQRITDENINMYEKEMREVQTELVGLRVVLAALDKEIHATLTPFIARLYQMDVELSNAMILYYTSKEKGLVAMALVHQQSLNFDDELLQTATELKRFQLQKADVS